MARSRIHAEIERLRQAGGSSAAPLANGQANGHAVRPWEVKPSGELVDTGITAADLVGLELPEPKFAIDGLLCEGLTILGGRPKMGKSWLALLLAWAVAGGHDLDGRRSRAGSILYLSLEDTRRRLKSRLEMLQAALGWPVPSTLKIHTAFPRADQGGLYQIVEWLSDQKGNGRLVVIDTLAKFRRPMKGNGNNYADDYEALGEIKSLADRHGFGAMVIHHTRKMPAEDPFDELSGTLAISGAADGLMVLDRKRGADEARLFVTGRDMPDSTIKLKLDRESFRWHFGASSEGIDTSGRHISPAENRIEACKAWIREFLGRFAYPSKEITEAGAKVGFSFHHVRSARAELSVKNDGDLVSTNKLPGHGDEWWCGFGKIENWILRPRPGGPTVRQSDSPLPENRTVGNDFDIPD